MRVDGACSGTLFEWVDAVHRSLRWMEAVKKIDRWAMSQRCMEFPSRKSHGEFHESIKKHHSFFTSSYLSKAILREMIRRIMNLCDIYVGCEAVWYVSTSSTLVKKLIASGWNIKIFVVVSIRL